MGQISEFSLILAALGLSLGHIDKPTMGLITLVGLITIGLSWIAENPSQPRNLNFSVACSPKKGLISRTTSI